MDTTEAKALLNQVKQSLDGLLLHDREQLNGLMRRIRRRIHDHHPADRLLQKLIDFQASALQRVRKRAAVKLTLEYPDQLPISGKRHEIRKRIEEHQVLIVCGTTGSGKTTQLPKILLEAGCGRTGRIGITQPRRLAATGMARRVAEEMGTDFGRGVGCQVRFDDQTGDETVVKFMTDGILLAETQHDRHLLQYDCIIIDEAHERSLNIDFLLGYLKNLLSVRTDLKIVISSATLDAASFAAFFNDAPVITVEGRTYPVEDFFLPPGRDEELANHVLRAIRWITEIDDEGDVLVFLPGEREIRDTAKKLEGQHWKNTEILPLFGRLSMGEQHKVFKTGGARRIILATNVAETSITIPGIHYVIDSGLVRLSRYNPRTQVQGLQIEQVSQASARQRRGRCGRITDGICIYLYDRDTLENSAAYTDPEIRRTSLAGVILQMDLLGLPPIDRFPLIDPPQPALIQEGYRTLQDIGAIDEHRKLTPMGQEIARYPVDPHLARMLVQARDEGALPELLVLVAFLSIQDVRERPAEKADDADLAHRQWMDTRSDFMTILNLWQAIENERGRGGSHGRLRKFCRKNFINYRRVMEWRNLWQDLRQTAREPGGDRSRRNVQQPADEDDATALRDAHYDLVHRSLLAGLPANIGLKEEEEDAPAGSGPDRPRRRGASKSFFRGARGRRFFIFPGSALFRKPPDWVMTFALVETTRIYARIVAEIEPQWLVAVAPHLCKAVYSKPEWNPDQGFVYARESMISGGLTLTRGKKVHFGPIQPDEARRIFIRDALVPGNLKTRGGWLPLHQRMLDEIAALEEKIRRPGALLDTDAIYDHFDQLLPEDIYSVRTLEQWLRRSKARIAMPREQAVFPQTVPIRDEDYPEELVFNDQAFHLIYTFEPGDRLDGIAMVCPAEKLAVLPEWAPDWLVPGWLETKVNRLLRTLPRNLREPIAPIDRAARDFCENRAEGCTNPDAGPLLEALSLWLQQVYALPVDATDFDESALPDHLRMKVIEMRGDEIVQIHTSVSSEHRQHAQLDGATLAFAKWTLPPGPAWPGDAIPEFITARDAQQTRGYPALTDENGGVGRKVFLSPVDAAYSHGAGLVRLFRIQQADQVRYVEKRPPLTPTLQLTLSAIDSGFLTDLTDCSIRDALTGNGRYAIRDEAAFAQRASAARGLLYETFDQQAQNLAGLLEQREALAASCSGLAAETDSLDDLEMQLAFLFRPGFLQLHDVFSRYPRYLKGMELRIQRIRSNPQSDLRKMEPVIPFQTDLSTRLLACDNIVKAYELLEFAMLLEEFRVNRFAPEIKTPVKVSAARLKEAWQSMQYV